MNDGSIVFSTALDNKQLEKQLGSITKKIESIQDKIDQKRAEQAPLAQQSSRLAAQLDAAKAQLEYMQSGEKFFSSFAIEQQENAVRATQKEWDSIQGRVDKYDEAIRRATIELDRNKQKADAVSNQLAAVGKHSDAVGKAMERAKKSMSSFSMRMREVVRSALLFTVISQAFAGFRKWAGEVVMANADASAAIARLKAALLTLAQPLIGVLIPAFTAFVNVLSAVINQIARLSATFFGTTIDQSKKSAVALQQQTKAIKGTGAAAKKAGKQLATFDEINQLRNTSSSGGGGASGGGQIAPDFGALGEFDSEEYKKKIDEITVYISGALLALGAILFFSGANIPLGLGLMMAGALGLAAEIKENWGAADGQIKQAINLVLITLGGAAFVLGAILAFSGVNLPLGIGLMLAGAAALGTMAKLNWDSMSPEIQRAITAILLVVGAAAFVIGAILTLTGANVPLGIGLMITGAAALATAAVVNWKSMSKPVKSAVTALLIILGEAFLVIGCVLALTGANIPLGIALIAAGAAALATAAGLNWDQLKGDMNKVIGAILLALGAAVLMLGAILAFTGVNIPLGIALLLAGAAALATAVAINWSFLSDKLRGEVGTITGIVGGALLLLGIVLCLSGVGIPLGIALIAAGAASLVTVTAVNWNALLDKLKGAWSNIKSWWNTDVAPKLTLAFWQAQFNNIKEGLISKIKDAVNGGITLFNRFIDWLNSKMRFSWDSFSILGKEIIPAGSVQLFTVPKIPMLAQGAVIPPNREFLAMLGDQKSGNNIEAPESLIRKIVREEGGGTGNRPITVVMQIDGREFGRVVYQANNTETQRVGVRLAPV